MTYLQVSDPELQSLMIAESNRQQNGLEMIASENYTSPAVMEAVGSILTNKYAEGYPGRRYYGGCEVVDQIENLARDRATQLFGAEFANVQAHSGSQAARLAGVTGGARVGSPSEFRIARVVVGGWIAARMRIGPALQLEHSITSISKTRCMSSDQL